MLTKKKGLVLLIGLLFMLTLSACGNDEETTEEPEDSVVATVNDEAIYESEWQQAVDRTLSGYEQQGIDFETEQGQMIVEQVESQALEQLIHQTVLYQQAEANDFTVDEDAAQAELDSIKAAYESDEAFAEALEANMFTEQELIDMFEIELSINAYLESQLEEVTVTELEKIEFYEEYKAQSEEQGQSVESYDTVEDQIEQQLISNKEQEQISAILESLIEESDIERNI